MRAEHSTETVAVKIPFTTILTVLFAAAVVVLLVKIAPLLLTLSIAAMLAAALHPVAEWLERRGLNRGLTIAAISLALFSALALMLVFVLPSLFGQARAIYDNLPQLRQDILTHVGQGNPLYPFLDHALHRENLVPRAVHLQDLLGAGTVALGGLTEVLLTFVLTLYLLADGPRVIDWCMAFFSPVTQNKIDVTLDEIGGIVSAYIAGQVITSVLSFIYVAIALKALSVPHFLLLAFLSGIFDVLPVLGFVLAVVPAMLFALEISALTSAAVLALYLLYHALENYVIVPFVYGNRLRVASLVVFLGLLVAGLIAGIKGAIAILPVLASYPVIERIWLRRYVRAEAVAAHARADS